MNFPFRPLPSRPAKSLKLAKSQALLSYHPPSKAFSITAKYVIYAILNHFNSCPIILRARQFSRWEHRTERE